jgi:hypothetical protein
MKRNRNDDVNANFMMNDVKYGEKNKYICRNDNKIIIDYCLNEYWYDHKHTEKIYCIFEIDKKDETLLKLIHLKMESDDLYGNLPLSSLEYKHKKDDLEFIFRYNLENNKFCINYEEELINKDKDKDKTKEYIINCIEQALNFIGKIDLHIINETKHQKIK